MRGLGFRVWVFRVLGLRVWGAWALQEPSKPPNAKELKGAPDGEGTEEPRRDDQPQLGSGLYGSFRNLGVPWGSCKGLL